MTTKCLLTIPAILACFTLSAIGDVITPTGATSTTSADVSRVLTETIDGSLLSGGGTSGDILTETVSAATTTDGYWLSASSAVNSGNFSTTETLIFNLGGTFDVDTVYIWPYIRSQASRGLKSFDLSYSSDGVNFTFAQNVSGWTQGPASGTAPVQTQAITEVTGVTHIRLNNLQVFANNGGYIALSEIRFGGVPAGTPAGPVNAGQSTVDASPAAVLADGTSTSTITVTLRDSVGTPVGSEGVTLANTSGPGSPVISPVGAQTTNGLGVATFTVTSASPGTEVFTATSVTDTVVVTDTASVDFQALVVDAGQSAVSASPALVPANNVTTSTITVTVKNAGGLPLPGKLVSLSGDGSATIDPAGAGTDTTNASGVATFTVKSGAPGSETFTATSESVSVTQTASVNFIEVPTGPVITPTAATSTTNVDANRIIDRAIDGTGLADLSNPSSVLDDEHLYGDGNQNWLSASGAVAGGVEELTFNLGGTYDVDAVYYWPYTRDYLRNLLTFDISYSTDGGSTFSTPVSSASLGMANWGIQNNVRNPSFVEARAFSTLSGVTHIRFSNLQNHGDTNYFALSEIRFGGVSVGTSGYATWSGGAAANGDANGDGVKNAVAYALGAADVDENAIGLLPGFDNSDPNNFVFTFDRSDVAEADTTTTITVEYGSDLSGWTTAPNVGDGVTVDDSGLSVGGLTPVIVTIPKSLAVGGKLFARLNVAVSP